MTKPETPAKEQQEAEILHPHLTVHLTNTDVVEVREFTWGQSLRMGSRVRPLAEAVASEVSTNKLVMGHLWKAMEDHVDLFLDLVGTACYLVGKDGKECGPWQRDADWAEALGETDGERIAAAFWMANKDFFGRAVQRAWERKLDHLRQAESDESAQENLSPDSSAWDTTTAI